mmetsp:Transcript_4206/g.6639  ORF Transcript_4206/g.6639 Transcript_4206/m.6639 type:complete len:129 (+) Transcript_4206:362-748(+)
MTAYYLFSHCVTLSAVSADFPDPEDHCPRPERLVTLGNLLEIDVPGSEQRVAFDMNINEDENNEGLGGYKMVCDNERARTGCIKHVSSDESGIWGEHTVYGQVRFMSLHFQGSSKYRIKQFVEKFSGG